MPDSAKLERQVDDMAVEGWKVSKDQGHRVILTRPDYGSLGGHVLVAILTVWWTLGLGNAAYAGYRYVRHSEKRVIRDEDLLDDDE